MSLSASASIVKLLGRAVSREEVEESLCSPPECGDLAREMSEQGVAATLYPFLRDSSGVAQPLLETAKAEYERALLQKDLCVTKLAQLRNELTADGRVVLMQGLALCEYVYKEPLARTMTDLDLCIPDGNIEQCRSALARNGFEPLGSYRNVWAEGGLQIDLHEDPWGADRIPARRLLVDTIAFETVPSSLVPGYYVPAPSCVGALSAFHGLKHGFSRGVWTCDVAMLHREGYLNADQVRQTPFLTLAIECLSRQGILRSSRETVPVDGLRRRLALAALDHSRAEGIGELVLAMCAPSWYGSARYLWGTLVPPRPVLTAMYGPRFGPLLLARRLTELFTLAGRAVAGLRKHRR